MWRLTARQHAVPWGMLSCQASQESMHWAYLEKAEMFGISGRKDTWFYEIDPV